MELWIRSQDKNRLVKADCVEYEHYKPSIIYEKEYYGIAVNEYEFGEYKTKERALEVLDEIQKLLQPQILCKKGKIIGSFDNTIYKENDRYEIQELSTYVYEMPKD